MKKIIIGLAIAMAASWPKIGRDQEMKWEPAPQIQKIEEEAEDPLPGKIKQYLEEKKSPLAEYAEALAGQKHWRLIVAISHIESGWCKKSAAHNCWGIKGKSGYRRYAGFEEAITDANQVIEKQQGRGRWLTVDDMNGSYNQPGSANWAKVVKGTIRELETI